MLARLSPFAKLLLLAICAALAVPDAWMRFTEIEGLSGQGVYVLLAGMTWAGLIAAAHIRSTMLRIIWALLLGAAGMTLGVFHQASGQFMTYDAFINMLYSAGFAGDALRQNGAAFWGAGWRSALLAAAIIWPVGAVASRSPRYFRRAIALAPLLVLAALTALLFLRGGEGGRSLAPGFTGTAYAALALYESGSTDYGPRKPPIAAPAMPPKIRHLVLVVDESIAAKYLALNDPRGVATPLSDPPSGVAVHNFGVAAAVTGCSVGANVTLRYGGTRQDYRSINASSASIWAYAKQAGMQTVYLDGQRENGALQNLMDQAERAEVDRFVQFGDVPVEQRDIHIAETLAELLADPAPKFILVNKVGAHFPVHDKYPDAALVHEPALPRGNYRGISDTGDRSGFAGTAEDWRRYRNSYRNTLEWNVGHFFERVFASADMSQVLMFYTSDHGQLLHEDGQPGTTTHCSANPPPEEGAVPLAVIEGAGEKASEGASGLPFAAMSADNRDRSSAYMIFPTLLAAMGYDPAVVEPVYGRSLLQPSRDPMSFNARFNARLNLGPVWTTIDPAGLPRPPIDDSVAP